MLGLPRKFALDIGMGEGEGTQSLAQSVPRSSFELCARVTCSKFKSQRGEISFSHAHTVSTLSFLSRMLSSKQRPSISSPRTATHRRATVLQQTPADRNPAPPLAADADE